MACGRKNVDRELQYCSTAVSSLSYRFVSKDFLKHVACGRNNVDRELQYCVQQRFHICPIDLCSRICPPIAGIDYLQ